MVSHLDAIPSPLTVKLHELVVNAVGCTVRNVTVVCLAKQLAIIQPDVTQLLDEVGVLLLRHWPQLLVETRPHVEITQPLHRWVMGLVILLHRLLMSILIDGIVVLVSLLEGCQPVRRQHHPLDHTSVHEVLWRVVAVVARAVRIRGVLHVSRHVTFDGFSRTIIQPIHSYLVHFDLRQQ